MAVGLERQLGTQTSFGGHGGGEQTGMEGLASQLALLIPGSPQFEISSGPTDRQELTSLIFRDTRGSFFLPCDVGLRLRLREKGERDDAAKDVFVSRGLHMARL